MMKVHPMPTISKLKNRRAARRKDERGMALITALMLSTMLLTAGAALILTTSMSATNAFDSTAETQAYYAAEAGLQATLNVLRGNVGPNVLSYRKAITPADSNFAGDTASNGANAYARLSQWLTYDPNFPDRVKLDPTTAYTPLNGSAYNVVLTDPDNSAFVSFTTVGAFDNNAQAATATKTIVIGNGNNAPKTIITFTGANVSALNTYPTGATNLGSFNVQTGNGGGATIATPITFKYSIVQTLPWTARIDVDVTISTPALAATPLTIDLKSTAYYGEGVLYTMAASSQSFALGNNANITRNLSATLTAPEPKRLLVRVNGFGPRNAKKQMEMMVGRFVFDYWPRGLIAIRSADPVNGISPPMTFDAGSSAAYTYSGNEPAGGTNTAIAGFAVTSAVDYALISNLGATGQVTGNPPAQLVPVTSLVSWLQTADEARRTLNKLQTDAINQHRYFTNASPPPDYGTTADPVFTFMDGDATLPNGGGAGLLVCTGTITIDGNTPFDGLMLALGNGVIRRNGGGSGNSLGAFALASFDRNNWGGPFLAPTFNGNGGGNSNVQYDPNWIKKALLSASRYTIGVSEF